MPWASRSICQERARPTGRTGGTGGADEAPRGVDAAGPGGRPGPRRAAPRRPLSTGSHMPPPGKAIALAAMPAAVLMGLGFTPTLARADDGATASKSLTAD